MQASMLELIRCRTVQGCVTTSLDILGTLRQAENSQTRRKSIWRSLRSLERRGLIAVYSLSGERTRDSGGSLRWIAAEVRDETKRPGSA